MRFLPQTAPAFDRHSLRVFVLVFHGFSSKIFPVVFLLSFSFGVYYLPGGPSLPLPVVVEFLHHFVPLRDLVDPEFVVDGIWEPVSR